MPQLLALMLFSLLIGVKTVNRLGEPDGSMPRSGCESPLRIPWFRSGVAARDKARVTQA